MPTRRKGFTVKLRSCVLIHGGWHGGWHWEEVAARLRAAGAAVHAPTLTGLAERAGEANAATNLSTHVADVVSVLKDNCLDETVLVAHSYGGMVATGVAAAHAGLLAEIVYLDAFLPKDGQSVGELMGTEFVAAAHAAADAAGTPTMIPPMFSAEDITGWSGRRAADLSARMCPHPMGTLEEPVRAAAEAPCRRSYIHCNVQPLEMFAAPAELARQSPDWGYYELASPHDAVHVMPAAVAGLIEARLGA